MKLSKNRKKILKCLFSINSLTEYHLTGPDLRLESGLAPLAFKNEIRALINLGWITSGSYRYMITDRGKAILSEALKKESNEGKNRELFK